MTATIIVDWTASRLIPPVKPAFFRGISERRRADQRMFGRAAFDRLKTDQCTWGTKSMDDLWRQPSGSCTFRSFIPNLRSAFCVSHQFRDFQSSFFEPEWDAFERLVEDICDCYRQKQGRRKAMTIVIGTCGSPLTHSLEILEPVVPANKKRPAQECLLVTSTQYFIDVSGVRPRVPLRCTLLVSSEEAPDCVMETAAEPVASVFQGALQLNPLCVKASNQYSVVLVLLPRFTYTLSSDPTQMQREPRKRKPLRFVLWPEDVDCCRSLLRSSGTELSGTEKQEAHNHRRMLRTKERAAHPLSGQIRRKIPEATALAKSCIELPVFSDISREESEHSYLLSEQTSLPKRTTS